MRSYCVVLAFLACTPSVASATPTVEESRTPPPEITYMYTYADSYLLEALNRELSVHIVFVPAPPLSRRKEVEPLKVATRDLPDVFSLKYFSPRELYVEHSLTTVLPEPMIREFMPGYSQILDDNSAWNDLEIARPKEPNSQLRSGAISMTENLAYTASL